MERCLITFPSVYHAFRAERLLGQQHINVEMVPVPRSLSGSCEGIAAVVSQDQLQAAVDLLGEHRIIMLHKGIRIVD